jgi:MFS transporter, PPP family, 3-phenylpropionic acid transporter
MTASPSSGQRGAIPRALAYFYAAQFVMVGLYLPYVPVWLHWRGMSEQAIAILLAAPPLARILFTPTIAFAADRLGKRGPILVALAWGTLLALGLLWAAGTFWQLLAAVLVLALAWTTIMPLTEALAVRAIRKTGLDYGRVRLWGSLTFIGASFGGGAAIGVFGAGVVLPLLFVASLLLLLGAYILPAALTESPPRPMAAPPLRARDAFALAHTPLFLLFLLTTSAIQASHAVYYTFGTLHWQAQGIPMSVIGLLWAVGVGAEIVLFAFSGRLIARFGPARLLWLAALSAVIRWGAMALDPPLSVTFLVQILHAMTFGAAHLAAIHFMAQAVPEDRAATAQGLYAAVTAGLAMGGAIALSGPLYHALSGGAYAAMAALGLIACLSSIVLIRRWKGGLIIGGEPEASQPQSAGEGGEIRPAS